MNRDQAIPYVAFVVDDALNGRVIYGDQFAIIRDSGNEFKYASVLVGWQCGFAPLFVAVHSYLDVKLDPGEAEDLARDYLTEIGWFSKFPNDADYILE